MSPASGVPSAWDDDFETIADVHIPSFPHPSPPSTPLTILQSRPHTTTSVPTAPILLSRAARLTAHQASNNALWSAASSPDPSLPDFAALQTSSRSTGSGIAPPPSTTAFKPALKVLSRKPTAANAAVARQDEEDSEEEAARLAAESLRERTERARAEREEKERRYVEVRARLFGEDQGTKAKQGAEGQGMTAGNGARRGGRRGGDGRGGRSAASASASSADQSPARGAVGQRLGTQEKQTSGKVLYDPTYQPKPGSVSIQRRDRSTGPGQQQQPIRQPQGPDSSGRGGFNFARGGGRGALGKT